MPIRKFMLIKVLIGIMNIKGHNCRKCNNRMLKVIARAGGDRDILIGYYCPICKVLSNKDMIALIPITLLTDCDPYLKTADPGAAYDAIIKASEMNKDRAFYITHKQIDTARDQIIDSLEPVCRENIPDEKIVRIDREKIKKELQNNFIKCFR
jgi:hypothetical protein